MNFFNMFEDRIAGIFGTSPQGYTEPFSFKKLGKRAVREMEGETYVIDGVDTAPALFTILVSSEDDAVMRALYASLTEEIRQLVEGHARNKGYTFVGQPLVRFMVDPSLRNGKFSVFAENVDARTLNRLRDEEESFLGEASNAPVGRMPVPSPTPRNASVPRTERRQRPVAAEDAYAPQQQFNGADAGLGVLPASDMEDPYVLSDGFGAPAPAAPMAGVPAAAAPVAAPAPAPAPAQPAGIRNVPLVNPRRGAMMAAQAQSQAAPAPAAQPAAQPQVAAAPMAAPAPAASPAPARSQRTGSCMLIDRQSGRTYSVNSDNAIIGRERSSGGVVLHDPNVSRRHAELMFDGRDWHIRDLHSTNGTLVNDVDVDTCVLRSGDLLTLGLMNLEFREN